MGQLRRKIGCPIFFCIVPPINQVNHIEHFARVSSSIFQILKNDIFRKYLALLAGGYLLNTVSAEGLIQKFIRHHRRQQNMQHVDKYILLGTSLW